MTWERLCRIALNRKSLDETRIETPKSHRTPTTEAVGMHSKALGFGHPETVGRLRNLRIAIRIAIPTRLELRFCSLHHKLSTFFCRNPCAIMKGPDNGCPDVDERLDAKGPQCVDLGLGFLSSISQTPKP